MTESISSSSSSYLSMLQSALSEESTTETDEDSSMSTSEILAELRQNGMVSTMTAQDIADEYGISLAEAQKILETLQGDSEEEAESQDGYTLDNPIPDDSTVSYHV